MQGRKGGWKPMWPFPDPEQPFEKSQQPFLIKDPQQLRRPLVTVMKNTYEN